ncbi:hypothetical protein AAFM48_28295 [Burkholderia pseudomallei]
MGGGPDVWQIVAFGVKKDVSGNIGSGHRPFDDGLVECQHQVRT